MAASEEQQLKEQQLAREEIEAREGILHAKNTSAVCPKQASVKNLVGVIGPASSTVTIQVSLNFSILFRFFFGSILFRFSFSIFLQFSFDFFGFS